nr:50S ribosomal protein L6 [Saprospiraceae bacterium]
LVTVKGPKGSLSQKIDVDLQVELDGNELSVKRPTNQKRHREIHGLSRALLANMVKGVSDGFTKNLELVGVGYRAANTGNLIEFSVGYSHPIYFYVPDELNVETATEKGKAPVIKLSGTDKQLLGQVAAKIRSYRKPEPYKGKGIKFSDEIIRRKAGKTAGK